MVASLAANIDVFGRLYHAIAEYHPPGQMTRSLSAVPGRMLMISQFPKQHSLLLYQKQYAAADYSLLLPCKPNKLHLEWNDCT